MPPLKDFGAGCATSSNKQDFNKLMKQESIQSLYPSQYIITTCRIRERFAQTAYHATLPNGKETVAFVQRPEANLLELIQPGDNVQVTISPADLNRARIRTRI